MPWEAYGEERFVGRGDSGAIHEQWVRVTDSEENTHRFRRIRIVLKTVHGEDKIADELSGYYLARHLQRTYDGMTIVIPVDEWCVFRKMSTLRFIQTLQQLAGKVNIAKF